MGLEIHASLDKISALAKTIREYTHAGAIEIGSYRTTTGLP